MKPTKPAILLDLDGTLVDTAADLMAALNTTLAQHGRRQIALDTVKSMIGDGIAALVEKGFAATGDSLPACRLETAIGQCIRLYEAHPSTASRLFPEVGATLLALKRDAHPLAVCTNKPEHLARRILDDLGIGTLLDSVVGGDTLAVRKPDGAHLQATLQRLDLAEDTGAVMVGDSRNDVLAARNAGLPVIFVTYGYNALPLSVLQPDRVIESFAQLPQALAALFRHDEHQPIL